MLFVKKNKLLDSDIKTEGRVCMSDVLVAVHSYASKQTSTAAPLSISFGTREQGNWNMMKLFLDIAVEMNRRIGMYRKYVIRRYDKVRELNVIIKMSK